MKSFWSVVLKLLVKAALYAAEHPDQVVAIANEAKGKK